MMRFVCPNPMTCCFQDPRLDAGRQVALTVLILALAFGSSSCVVCPGDLNRSDLESEAENYGLATAGSGGETATTRIEQGQSDEEIRAWAEQYCAYSAASDTRGSGQFSGSCNYDEVEQWEDIFFDYCFRSLGDFYGEPNALRR